MWSDPIADLLTQLRNGIRNRSKQVTLPYSRVKMNICQVFKDEGYLSDVEKIPGAAGRSSLRVTMKYGPRGEQVWTRIRRESKVGCRKYVGVNEIPKVLNGLGIAVLSTSRGVMSDRKCREQRIGGELICTAY